MCNCGEKEGEATPPVGTRVSYFERSLLEPNSARLTPGPEGDNATPPIVTRVSYFEHSKAPPFDQAGSCQCKKAKTAKNYRFKENIKNFLTSFSIVSYAKK